MIEIITVEECPHTKTGRGILRLSPAVIATFAGAVFDRDEWMAIMVGKRSEDGLDITVDSLRIPLQTRNTVNCEFVKPEPLADGEIGVVHSHHSMLASFSTTDDTELNPRFPVSIVVAQLKHNSSEAEELLGFTYQAEGRAPLPCGTIGIIPFVTVPTEMPEFWPKPPVTGYSTPDAKTSLYGCPHTTRTLEGRYHKCVAQCGATSTEKAIAIYGRKSGEFMAIVQQQTHKPKHTGWQNQQGKPYSVVDNRAGFVKHDYWKDDKPYTPEDRIRHWSDY